MLQGGDMLIKSFRLTAISHHLIKCADYQLTRVVLSNVKTAEPTIEELEGVYAKKLLLSKIRIL